MVWLVVWLRCLLLVLWGPGIQSELTVLWIFSRYTQKKWRVTKRTWSKRRYFCIGSQVNITLPCKLVSLMTGWIQISLLRASHLATQKASPLGLSCHLFSLTSMKLRSLVSFCFILFALHCYNSGGVAYPVKALCSLVERMLSITKWATSKHFHDLSFAINTFRKMTTSDEVR